MIGEYIHIKELWKAKLHDVVRLAKFMGLKYPKDENIDIHKLASFMKYVHDDLSRIEKPDKWSYKVVDKRAGSG